MRILAADGLLGRVLRLDRVRAHAAAGGRRLEAGLRPLCAHLPARLHAFPVARVEHDRAHRLAREEVADAAPHARDHLKGVRLHVLRLEGEQLRERGLRDAIARQPVELVPRVEARLEGLAHAREPEHVAAVRHQVVDDRVEQVRVLEDGLGGLAGRTRALLVRDAPLLGAGHARLVCRWGGGAWRVLIAHAWETWMGYAVAG